MNPYKHRWIPFMNRSGFYRSYLWERSFREWLLGRVIEHDDERQVRLDRAKTIKELFK